MHATPAAEPLTLELPNVDARALRALLDAYAQTQNELRHARETSYRRGDDQSHERVLDLECESSCAAQKLAQLAARVLGPALSTSRELSP